MNIYDRIANILLEAIIEDYLERLDEVKKNEAGVTVLSRDQAARILKQARKRKKKPASIQTAFGNRVTTTGETGQGSVVQTVKPVKPGGGGQTKYLGIGRVGGSGNVGTRSAMVEPKKKPKPPKP